MGGNQALSTNADVSQHANLEITTHGSNWLFAVCAVMGTATLVFLGLAFTRPSSHRHFHYITAGITFVACIAYFAMGSNLGQTPIAVEFVRPFSSHVGAAGTREIFYVRYIDWFITTPLLLLDLLLTAGLPRSTILCTIFADLIMVVCGLVGALVRTRYKWGFWTFGTASFLFVVWQLLWDGRRHAAAHGGAIQKTYLSAGVLLIFVWFLYPVAWGLCEGGNVLHPDSEAIFYGVLDIVSKVGFGAVLLWGHRGIDPADLGLHVREPGGFKGKGVMTEQHQHGDHHGMMEDNNGYDPNLSSGSTAAPMGGVNAGA
ncbi:FDD123 protein [Bombardia bombarda]|uniref:FDD123 protein n=1 Tax=Bombardia bombarda TaxID=252184 RepID=A0AA40C8E2_9PEZI|nr:FDD123 protein [Bombardia bombarda]